MAYRLCQFPGCTGDFNHLGAHTIHSGVAHRYGLDSIPARIEPCHVVVHRCHAPGCQENHRSHHCRNCGDRDSDHLSSSCPRLQMAPRGVVIVRGGLVPTPFGVQVPPPFDGYQVAPHFVVQQGPFFAPPPPFGPLHRFPF